MSGSAEIVAIKLAIQFCVNIKTVNYLFTDIFQFFSKFKLQDKFLKLLEPSILAGRFRDAIIPDRILRHLIMYYEKKEDFSTLEKLVQQINFSQYTHMEDLAAVCQYNFMISALIHIFTSSITGKSDESTSRQNSLQVLNNLFQMLVKSNHAEARL